ncbi:MAG: hypothetical protein H8E12_09130 [Rhodobacteraceae bacterium]|nr:hypothetical protein [Paracoccaceae bacterium]
MKPEIKDTDIIIRRADNGWIVFSGSEYEEGHFITTVYEETMTEWGEAKTLIHLLREHFSGYTQSKKLGGIKLEVSLKGYALENDEEQNMTKDDANVHNNDHYVTKVQELPNGELFVELPQKLIGQLGWECGDEVEWDESEICEDWGEHKGFTLSNKTKLSRDGLE